VVLLCRCCSQICPAEDASSLFYVQCDDKIYPARVVNLPCPVEVHKTHDHAIYYKSADIGQMLVVYESPQAMETAENAAGYVVDGFPSYYPSGLTPPMKRVVQRRFASREHDAVPPLRKEVEEVEQFLQKLIASITKDVSSGTGYSGTSGKTLSSSNKPFQVDDTKIIEEIEEEIVDYEPFMDDHGRQPRGVRLDEKDKIVQMHPELWLPPLKEEKKATASATVPVVVPNPEVDSKSIDVVDVEVNPPPTSITTASTREKKEKKKKGGKKKKNSMEELNSAVTGAPKKGIASKKSREAAAAAAAAAVPPVHDIIEASAMIMLQGAVGADDAEELLALDDGFFDFTEGGDEFGDLGL